jgi:hypothetical protein
VIKSILKEANLLCITNNEEEKYLMTFQNFLSRVPKWNNDIISEETNRIIAKSGCNYLEDLLTCVHITQLKVLTSIRVGSQQKKIEIDIPKLTDFIHKIYIKFARKIYSNVYLFEKNIQPLIYQKNMRECETICKECILDVIRDSIPVERILRSYIDESNEEEIVEEIKETLEVDPSENVQKEEVKEVKEESTKVTVKKAEESTEVTKEVTKEAPKEIVKEIIKVETAVNKEKPLEQIPEISNTLKNIIEKNKKSSLSFSDTDIAFDKNTGEKTEINAPKTMERLAAIATAANKKRKDEEEGYDADDDDGPLKIGNTVKLDILDIHDLEKDIKLKPDISNEIHILS